MIGPPHHEHKDKRINKLTACRNPAGSVEPRSM
jgi:hypothetical protein